MEEKDKTHYRKAFNAPYLSSADIVAPTVLTISHVTLAGDATKKTKDKFNTAHFVERELRKGEVLKPMILNATNSKTLKELTGSPYIDDWKNVAVIVYVDNNVKMMGETVDGLRISTEHPKFVADTQRSKIETLIKEVDADIKKFLLFFQVESLELLPAAKYNEAVKLLENKRK